jgi:hypothetical protein
MLTKFFGLMAVIATSAALTPTAIDAISSFDKSAVGIEAGAFVRSVELLALSEGRTNITTDDLYTASRDAGYRPSQWEINPVFDAATGRVYVGNSGAACVAVEIAVITSPDGSATTSVAEIVDRPLEECDRLGAFNPVDTDLVELVENTDDTEG